MGARPPYDHPHVYLDMGADGQILCPYCSTLYVHDARLAPDATEPDGLPGWSGGRRGLSRRQAREPWPTPAPILIAGGGIGGLALALALAKSGRRSIVLEQRETLRDGRRRHPARTQRRARAAAAGTGRGAASRGRRARCPGVHDGRTGRALARAAARALDCGSPRRSLLGGASRRPARALLTAAASAEPRITLRAGFDARLSGAARGRRAGAGASTATSRPARRSSAPTACGRACAAPSVPSMSPQFVGATATRTVIPVAAAGRLAVPVVGLWLTPGVNVVHYPVRGGARSPSSSSPARTGRASEWDAEADQAALIARLAGFHSSLTEVLAMAPSWRKWALYRLPPLPTLVGGPRRADRRCRAPHAALPRAGRRAGAGGRPRAGRLPCRPRRATWRSAFLVFEAKRRRRADRVQAMSRRNGRIYHLRAAAGLGARRRHSACCRGPG